MERNYEKGKDEVKGRNTTKVEGKKSRLLNFITEEAKRKEEEKRSKEKNILTHNFCFVCFTHKLIQYKRSHKLKKRP